MARIRRGTPNRVRRNAKNFTYEYAQKRLDETVEPFNQQVVNSLFVDAVEVDYFQRNKTGRACTCDKVEIRDEHKTLDGDGSNHNIAPIVPTVDDDSSAELGIELQDSDLFGDSPAEKLFGETTFDVSASDNMEDDDIPQEIYEDGIRGEGDVALTETTMYGTNANCGICYRTGFQPGYTSYGKQRFVLTNWDIASISGFTLQTTATPNRFSRQGPASDYTFVEFVVAIPKYFVACKISVRDNGTTLSDRLSLNGLPITLKSLQSYAGKEVRVKCSAKTFTHVVVEFDLGLNKLRANLGGETKSLDYTKLDPFANFSVVLPPTLFEVNTGDVLVVPKRRLVLRVIDMERKITADQRQIEWSVQTRLVQRTESLRDIAVGFKIL